MKNVIKFNVVMLVLGLALVGGKVFADDAKSDSEILGILMAGDRNEIASAQQAQGKDIAPEVMNYAKMIEQEHKADLDKLEALSKKIGVEPTLGAQATQRVKGLKVLAMLTPVNGKDFEKKYIDAMVQDHTEDLNLIDTDLSKDVKNPELKAQIAETRSHIAMHLDKAKQLQK
jgi:putative membrane protein